MKRVRPIIIEGDIARVSLTKGYWAIIDAADVHLIDKWKWGALIGRRSVYAVRKAGLVDGKRKTVLMHRSILAAPRDMQIDHINSNGLDNRRSNLRLATHTENIRNSRMRVTNTSGYKGVHRHKKSGRWIAKIRAGGKQMTLGYYDTPQEAHAAYAIAAEKMHGEFARAA